jgi:hypothetical protein
VLHPISEIVWFCQEMLGSRAVVAVSVPDNADRALTLHRPGNFFVPRPV